jgi:ferredoxin
MSGESYGFAFTMCQLVFRILVLQQPEADCRYTREYLFPSRSLIMAMVVTEPCFGCKYTDCVVVCPCDSFREGESMLFIDPEECIDCNACVPECPVSAIFYEDNVPPQWKDCIALNRELAAICPPIVEKKEPLCG